MRARLLISCAAVLLAGACARTSSNAASDNAAANAAAPAVAAAPATGAAPVSGVYEVGGKPAQLTEVTAHNGAPFDGKPITELVFSERPQDGPEPATVALTGKFGDALVVRVEPDGTVVGADLVHPALENGEASVSGMLKMTDFNQAGGQIAGHLSSGGPSDLFGQPVNVDLTFRAKAP